MNNIYTNTTNYSQNYNNNNFDNYTLASRTYGMHIEYISKTTQIVGVFSLFIHFNE